MGRVQDKVAIVTGGARGMGSHHARALVAEGGRVVIADVADDEGRALADELGEQAVFAHLDVSDPEQWSETVDLAMSTFGRLDVLVNNAGVADMAPLAKTTDEAWQRIIDINLTGAFFGLRAVVPHLAAHGGGSVINISSVEGMRGSAGLHAYGASKFGLRGLTKSVALEFARAGVRVNSIHPGFIETAMTESFHAVDLGIPLGRGADADEVSALVVYLASDESSYSTGAEFVVDGGLTAGLTKMS